MILFIDIQWYGGGNQYHITRNGKKEKSTFAEVWEILRNPNAEKLKSDCRYSESHYKIYIP